MTCQVIGAPRNNLRLAIDRYHLRRGVALVRFFSALVLARLVPLHLTRFEIECNEIRAAAVIAQAGERTL